MAAIRNYLEGKLPEAENVAVGIAGFTALVRVKEKYEFSADVPDIPVEDGRYIHDHIIVKPQTISIEGDVSDVHRVESNLSREQKRIQAEIGNLTSQYAPAKTQAQMSKVATLANTATDAIARIDGLIDAGSQALDFIGNKDDSKSNRQTFIAVMQNTFNAKQPIDITMPHKLFRNMVITLFSVSNDNETDATTFTLTAKQITLAESKVVAIAAKSTGGQTKKAEKKGAQSGKAVVKSELTNIGDYLKGRF